MATRAPPTVAASKQAFLLTQIRQLSRPLAPSRQWREEVAAASDATRQRKRKRRHDDEPEDNDHGAADKPPTARAVDDALAAVNAALAADHRRAHAPQATRHVAEQIERLYFWDGESRTGESGGGEAEESLLVGMDFSSAKHISLLPPQWPSARAAARQPTESARFRALSAQLTELSGRRDALRRRVARLRALRDVLAPFSGKEQWQADNDGVQGNRAEDDDDDNGQQDVETLKTRKAIGSWVPVQDALITRDGAAEKELERMRVLLARVGGRVAGLPSLEPNPDGREETAARGGVPETESFKMEKLLATF